MRTVFCVLTTVVLASCSGEDWSCFEYGKMLLSISSSGNLGTADKGCSCEDMREFEFRNFGSVDEDALKSDFGC